MTGEHATTETNDATKPLRIGIVVPHIFMQRGVLPHVIFSPARLAMDLAEGLQNFGQDVTLFSPGPVDTSAKNVTADLSLFESELTGRGDDYLDLLKKHPLTFVSLARQVQSELIAKAFQMANNDELDIVHIYTNEEDIALPFAQFCAKPVVFTHHDPFQLLVKYKSVFPKYKDLNWVSMSYSQRHEMPSNTNWIANIYHGLPAEQFQPLENPTKNYIAYLGRIIEPKGVHLAIAAVKAYNRTHDQKLPLKIAGKHYSEGAKDSYWQTKILPQIDDQEIIYEGYLKTTEEKQNFLGHAAALIIPSTFNEPFGMVMIESLACATPVIGLGSGAIPEVINDGKTGVLVEKSENEQETITNLAKAITPVLELSPQTCRQEFESRFTTPRMCQEHLNCYRELRLSIE